MKEFAKIDVGLREHPKILQAGDEAAWLFVSAILWSKEHDTDGLIPEYVVPRLTGIKQPHRAVRKLVDAGLLEVLEDGSYFVHDYLEHQESSEERRSKRHAASVAGRIGAAKRWGSEAPNGSNGNRHSEPHSRPDGERIAEEEEEVLPNPSCEEREDVKHLVDLLAELMLANDEKAKTSPQSKGWRDPVRLLLDRDGRTEVQVEQVIRWCQADDFWRTNILSPSKLRKQFGQLTLKMQADGVRAAVERGNAPPSSSQLGAAWRGGA